MGAVAGGGCLRLAARELETALRLIAETVAGAVSLPLGFFLSLPSYLLISNPDGKCLGLNPGGKLEK